MRSGYFILGLVVLMLVVSGARIAVSYNQYKIAKQSEVPRYTNWPNPGYLPPIDWDIERPDDIPDDWIQRYCECRGTFWTAPDEVTPEGGWCAFDWHFCVTTETCVTDENMNVECTAI